MLLLSGSRAAGNIPEGQKPGMFDFAESWIRDFFSQIDKPVLFVPYARPGGISEEEYFSQVAERFKKMNIEVVCAPKDGVTETSLKEAGGMFIGGGHTPTLLFKLQTTGSLPRIKKSVENGFPYMGSSAGSLVTCPTIKTNNDMPGPANDVMDLKALGLVPFQLNCHYMDDSMHDSKHQGETRDTRLREFCIFNPNVPVVGLYEGQAIRVQGDETQLWTSVNTRGTRSPIFLNDARKEISCQFGIPARISF